MDRLAFAGSRAKELGGMAKDAVSSALSWANTPSAAMQPIIDQNKAGQQEGSFWKGQGGIIGKDSSDPAAALASFTSGIPGFAQHDTSPTFDERMGRFREQHPVASFLLPIAAAGARPGYLPPTTAAAPGTVTGLTPWLQKLEGRLTTQVGDMGVKGAEKTAASALGSYRSARGDTSTILKALERVTGDPATDAASKALLASPEGKKLIMEVVQNAQARAPDALNRVEGLKALVDETHAAIPTARAAATSDEGLRAALKQRTSEQLGRYAIPAAGAAVGTAIGGPVGMGIGAAAGRGVSPGVRAVLLNNVLAPERRLLMTRSSLNTLDKLMSVPEKLGKFALPLTKAAQSGPDAVAATHFVLSQDPSYQAAMHDAAEGK